jgi:hypothetical protein
VCTPWSIVRIRTSVDYVGISVTVRRSFILFHLIFSYDTLRLYSNPYAVITQQVVETYWGPRTSSVIVEEYAVDSPLADPTGVEFSSTNAPSSEPETLPTRSTTRSSQKNEKNWHDDPGLRP